MDECEDLLVLEQLDITADHKDVAAASHTAHTPKKDPTSELESFRRQWQKELQVSTSTKAVQSKTQKTESSKTDSKHDSTESETFQSKTNVSTKASSRTSETVEINSTNNDGSNKNKKKKRRGKNKKTVEKNNTASTLTNKNTSKQGSITEKERAENLNKSAGNHKHGEENQIDTVSTGHSIATSTPSSSTKVHCDKIDIGQDEECSAECATATAPATDTNNSKQRCSSRVAPEHSNPKQKKLSTIAELDVANNNEDDAQEEDDDETNRMSWDRLLNRRDKLDDEQKENEARRLYTRGCELERDGELYQAIQQYRRAVQLVPDIESSIKLDGASDASDDEDDYADDVTDNCDTPRSLLSHLSLMMTDSSTAVCQPIWDQQARHVSCLPREILEHILHWMMGTELDVRSLLALSAVSRGWYILVTGHNVLWRRACQRVWGYERCPPSNHPTWREMFLTRARPRYNGVYVAKVSYFRSGECNFHDQNSQPWYLVTYYRLIRLFPDGCCLMLTTSDEPHTVVQHLATRAPRNGQVLTGRYELSSECHIVASFTHGSITRAATQVRKGRPPLHQGTTDVAQTDYNMSLSLEPSRRGSPNRLLVWHSYQITCHSVLGTACVSDVDVTSHDSFPNLIFSRVKSYTLPSLQPLT